MGLRKFFRTIVKIEILSEDEPVGDGVSLEEINYAITEGHCSGRISVDCQEQVTARLMARLLLAQGSDPEFMMLDSEGNEIKE